MNKILGVLNSMVEELGETNSTIEKKKIVSKFPECQEILKLIYSPRMQFYITSKNLKKLNKLNSPYERSIYILLEDLSTRLFTGHEAVSKVNGFISQNEQYRELIYKIIDKNLKVKIDIKLINSVFPDLIEEFSVSLADKYSKEINFEKEEWISQIKCDGCRCICIKENNDIHFFSRSGKEFLTLGNVKKDIEKYFSDKNNFVLDGEMCLVDNKTGRESFQGVMKEITKKNYTMLTPKYKIFDYLPVENFYKGYFNVRYTDRVHQLPRVGGTLDLLPYKKIENLEDFKKQETEAIEKGWEGLILKNNNAPYEAKRTKNMLKVKNFNDAEYVIIDTYSTTKKMLNDNGIEVDRACMGGVTILHKGNEVGVGSGWSDEERLYYFEHAEEIIGKTITVKYFEETLDKDGKASLRFPTKKFLYEGERDI